MRSRKAKILMYLLCMISFFANSQNRNAILASRLKNYNNCHFGEKTYLQFDKPYYATGDTLYFKAYVIMGERHDLSKISGVLYVDLIGTDNKANQRIKLQLVNGIGWGDFALPDSLPQGTYRVRAYTRWMRNAGDDGCFEKMIPIGTLHQNKVPESNTSRVKPVLAKADLQFFPEGGELISGINTKIAFKSIGINGMGTDVKGVVTDNTGKEVSSFASTHLGMGYFYLKPEDGKSYKSTITFADGVKEELPLPQISTKGISLTINNDSIANAAVMIQANPNYYYENKGKAYSVLIYSGGIATTVSCKLDSPTITMDIIKRKLFTGITTVTLFSSNNEPIAERLIFIQNYDQLNLDVTTDKDTYSTRGKVSLRLNARTRADSASMGHFSIAVTDENKVQQDENNETTILTDLLVTSDLKGTVEQPNYYFADIGNQSNYDKQKGLDLVMLTHGYRHFSWKQVFAADSTNNTAITYQPETGLSIRGTAKNAIGIPLKKGTVTLLSSQTNTFISTNTDDKGKFSFDNLIIIDSTKFILQATNSKGNNTTQLFYDRQSITPLPIAPLPLRDDNVNPNITDYLKNDEKQQEELNRMGIGKGKLLKEVKIKGVKENNNYPSSNLGGPGHADQVWRKSDIHGGGTLTSQLNGVLRGVTFVGGTSPYLTLSLMSGAKKAAPMLIVVDGAIGANYTSLNLSDVETVEVLSGANASIYGGLGGGGVLVITTRHGTNLEAKDIQSVGVLSITVQGFYKAREFYSPKYDASMPINHPDLRSTIYWAPEVVTDKDGNASIDFYNADGKGTYKVVVEGIDEKGNIGRQVYRYKVE